MKRLSIVLFILLMLTGVSGVYLHQVGTLGSLVPQLATPTATPEPCYVQAKPFVQKIDPLLDRWIDIQERAGSTSRIALSPVVGEMQDLRREAKAVVAPECAQRAKDLFLDSMGYAIDAYLAFMAEKPDSEVSVNLDKATSKINLFNIHYRKLKFPMTPTPAE